MPARVPVSYPRPTVQGRPLQRPRIASEGEGTSSRAPIRASDPSSSSFQMIAGRLACPSDLMTQCWMPSSELSHQFLSIDTSLELMFFSETSTHVIFSLFYNPVFKLALTKS